MDKPGAWLYDQIGVEYPSRRRADPRLFRHILAALGDVRRVLNVGAGAGNYEPDDRLVVALDPSNLMLGHRRKGRRRAVQGVAERLPFSDRSFDISLATFTVHHWTDIPAGLLELGRVSARQVILFHDRALSPCYWIDDYFPEILDLPTEQHPDAEELGRWLQVIRTEVVPIPIDCTDGFCSAFWGRPEALLDPGVRAGSSALSQLSPDVADRDAGHLREDLESGAWDARYGFLRSLPEFDMGYRLLICGHQADIR